jgi:hypothetical protein
MTIPQLRKDSGVVDVPNSTCLSSSCNHPTLSTDIEPTVTQDQPTEKPTDEEAGHQLTRTSTIQSAKKKMSTILDNPIFSGFLLILAGISIAFQAGKNILSLSVRQMI